MERFLKECGLVFLIGVVFFVVPLELLSSKVYDESVYKREFIEGNADKIKLLLIGNSHFAVSFNPHVLGDSVFMTAQVGRDIYYDAEIVKRHVPTMANLTTVVCPVNIGNLTAGGDDLVIGVEYAKKWLVPCKSFPQSLLCQSLLFSGRLARNYFHSVVGCDSLGYLQINDKWDGRGPVAHPKKFPKADVAECASMLSEIARVCHECGVRMIAVACPQSDKLLKECTDDLYEDLYEMVAAASRVYPIEFRDYMDDPAFRADTLYFDSNHLNHEGATRFAERVKEDFGL